jgi:hypothetical protein
MKRMIVSSMIAFFMILSPAAAEGGRSGTLKLSSGEIYSGEIRFTETDVLKIYDLDKKKYISVTVGEIKSLKTRVVKSEMLKSWVFKEAGSPEKIYTGKEYPHVEFEHDVALSSGTTIRGHVVATVYITVADEERRFILKKKERGEDDQKLSDIIYVSEISFASAAAGDKSGGRKIKCSAKESVKILSALAVNRRDMVAYAAAVKDGNSFVVENLPEGIYDLFIETDNGLYCFFESPEKDNLSTSDRAEIRDFTQSVKDFFDEKSPLLVKGAYPCVRSLVEMKRFNPTSYEKKTEKDIYFRRIELWTLVRTETRWKREKITFIFREQVEKDKNGKKAAFDSALGGLDLTGEKTEASLDFSPKE